jgi:hypothetical protein
LNSKYKRTLRLISSQNHIINDILFYKNYDAILLRGLEKLNTNKVLIELHDGLVGGHFSIETTTQKILRDGYYFPTIFKDTRAYPRKC